MLAAEVGHYEVVEQLLEKGAVADLRDSDGWTAHDLAGLRGHDSIFELLQSYCPLAETRKLDANAYARAAIRASVRQKSATRLQLEMEKPSGLRR